MQYSPNVCRYDKLARVSLRQWITCSRVLPNMQKQASDALGAMLFEKPQEEEARVYN